MDPLNLIATIVICCVFGLLFFSVIGWLVCMIIDRQNIKRRKKYATMCLIAMLALVLLMLVSFIINFKRNTM